MLDLQDVCNLVATLNQKTLILFRIELLVVFVTLVFLYMFVMDFFRRASTTLRMKAIVSFFEPVSDSMLIYLLGAMQTAPFKSEIFPVWALLLVINRYSVGFISGYGVADSGERHFKELKNLINLVGTSILSLTLGSRLRLPLWLLLALQILKSLYRCISHAMANKSAWHGRSSELISEYMRDWRPEEQCNPEMMDGYKYLVYGETAKLQKPGYILRAVTAHQPRRCKIVRAVLRHLHAAAQGRERRHTIMSPNTSTRSSMITLDKIWGCHRRLLRTAAPDPPSSNSAGRAAAAGNIIRGRDLKDLCLAFALSRLLRCRLQDVMLRSEEIRRINRKLVKARIIEERDNVRAFRIMELQLAFVNDYFNTRYPIVFWSGLGSLLLSILQSVATVGVVFWLSMEIRSMYNAADGELALVVRGVNVEILVTWTLMSVTVLKEIVEVVTYLLSDWTRLLLVCMYARNQEDDLTRRNCSMMEHLMLWLSDSRINSRRWHGFIGQYGFVQSYNYRPQFWNMIHMVSTGIVTKKDDGVMFSLAISVPEQVKPAVLEKLRAILDLDDDGSLKPLPKVIMTLRPRERMEWYGWACFDLQTSSHIILVWHIATSICEMELAKKHGVDLSKPGFLRSLVSLFTGVCSSPRPYLIDVVEQTKEKKPWFLCSLLSRITAGCGSSSKSNDKLTEELRERYIVANCLSRYCAYLLVLKPDLIPDGFLVPKMVFGKAVKNARDDILRGCDSLDSRYTKLKEEAQRAAQDSDSVKKGDDVVKQGALLAKGLLDHENVQGCWDILAGVWTELLVHMAPTWNVEAHKTCLEYGGEFITAIWALLWHCGIDKSCLWPEDDVPAATEGNDAGINKKDPRPREKTQKASADMSGHPIGTDDIHEDEGETDATREPDATNLRIGQSRVLSGNLEIIEESSPHIAGEDNTNVQTCMTGEVQNWRDRKVDTKGTEIYEEKNDTEGTESEADNLRIEPRGALGAKGSREIEEASQCSQSGIAYI